MKKINNLTLFLLLTFLSSTLISWGQADLVRWQGNAGSLILNPTVFAANGVSSSAISTGSSPVTSNETYEGFTFTNWSNSTVLVNTQYIQFQISATTGYKIDLSQFNFRLKREEGPRKYQVRYSKSTAFAGEQSVLVGESNTSASWANISLPFPNGYTLQSEETLYIRIYGYDPENPGWSGHRFTLGYLTNGPTLTGTVSLASLTNASNDSATTAQNFPVDIDILANDFYSELEEITITDGPANGDVTINPNNTVTYTPDTDYVGSDSFTYTIEDENDTSAPATVNITVTAPTAPTAVADAVSMMVNETKNINVLANDTPGSGAFDDVVIVASPTNGTAIVNPNNTVSYTPNFNYSGADSFQYHVTNMHNMTSNTVTVSITVNHVGLVTWNGADNGFAPVYSVSNIYAPNITNHGGGTLTNQGQYSQYFHTGGWPNPSQYGGYLNESRYVQFTLSPVGNYKIDLNQFNFEVQTDDATNGANFEVRYSKNSDFSQGYSSFTGTIGGNSSWGSKSGSLTSVSPVLPGETLYIRLYVYNTHNSVRIRHSWGGSTGPTITGSVSPVAMADLQVTKTVNNPTANVNSNVVFTLEAKNNGPDNATGVVVTDILPNGYAYVSSNSGSYDPGTGQWSIGNLSNGNTATLEITAKVLATGNYTNTASISSNQGDSNMGNNSSSVSVTPVFPDLNVTKIVDNDTPTAGFNAVFTITAENLGPADATGVIVTDILPNGYTYVNSDPSVGTYNPTNGKWTIGSLFHGVSETLTITAKVLATGTYNNTATIAGGETDPESGNNTSTVNVTPFIPSANLSITKEIDNPSPVVGNNAVFTITVENTGPDNATGVTVTDLLPMGFAYVSSTTSPGTGSYNPSNGKWVVGNLAASSTAVMTITAQTQASGPYSSTTSVVHDGNDPDMGNNTDTVVLQLSCGESCTNSIPNGGGYINVGAGQIYCLAAGETFTGTFSLAAGGTICIAGGATFTPSEAPIGGIFNGTIINNGTMEFPLYEDGTYTGAIENYGSFTSAALQNFAGIINNYGSITVSGGVETLDGGKINNYGSLNFNNIHFHGTEVHNYNAAVFIVTSGVNVYSGYWDNKLGGEIYYNGGNVNFTGDLDNSGYWEFERLSGLSSTLNNYGHMRVYNTASNISSTTYLTNDDILEFINVPEIQYNGPMLTNNGTITITHGETGNFKLNMAINQVYNNGIINVSGQFEQNAAGSKLVNNCTIICKTFFVGNGTATNNGLIHAIGTGELGGRPDGINIEGTSSIFINGRTGFTRGVNFRNSGDIEGYGSFYFTGTTNMESAGSFIGSSATEQILFFDTSQTGSIFDVPGGTVSNVMRPGSLTPEDAVSYDCSAPPSYAGTPPITTPYSTAMCVPADISFETDDYAEPGESPDPGDPFVLLYSTIKLFEYNNPSNPTNNSTNLVIAGKGTLNVNTTTGVITFTRNPAFTGGVLQAEYRISNKRSGDVVTYPSPRTPITITINALADIETEDDTTFCLGETLELSNPDADGVWSSENESIATIDEDGIVTGVSGGTTHIIYTKYFLNGDCSLEKEIEITIQHCSTPSNGLLITNPHIRQRTKNN